MGNYLYIQTAILWGSPFVRPPFTRIYCTLNILIVNVSFLTLSIQRFWVFSLSSEYCNSADFGLKKYKNKRQHLCPIACWNDRENIWHKLGIKEGCKLQWYSLKKKVALCMKVWKLVAWMENIWACDKIHFKVEQQQIE